MKLTYRDTVILGILLAVAILIAGFFLAIKPTNTKIKDDQATLDQKKIDRAEVEDKIAQIEPLKTEITNMYNETKKLSEEFVELNNMYNTRKIDQYLQHFAEEAEVKIMNLNVSDPTTGVISYYYFTPKILAEDMMNQADLNGAMASQAEQTMAESESLTARTQESLILAQYSVTVQGEKEQLWAYMEGLEKQNETIIINSASFTDLDIKGTGDDEDDNKKSKDDEDDEERIPQGTFVISLYSVYDLAQPDLEAD